jgi:hypothetical protein
MKLLKVVEAIAMYMYTFIEFNLLLVCCSETKYVDGFNFVWLYMLDLYIDMIGKLK